MIRLLNGAVPEATLVRLVVTAVGVEVGAAPAPEVAVVVAAAVSLQEVVAVAPGARITAVEVVHRIMRVELPQAQAALAGRPQTRRRTFVQINFTGQFKRLVQLEPAARRELVGQMVVVAAAVEIQATVGLGELLGLVVVVVVG